MARTVDPIKHEEKRREILQAAGRCFIRDGFRGASISDICKEAKLSPGHLYHYFDSKEEIVSAMTQASLDHAAGRVSSLVKSPDPISAMVAAIRQVSSGDKASSQMLLLDMLVEAGRNATIREIVRKHSNDLRDLVAEFLRGAQLRGQIERSLDADATAGMLIGVIDGVRSMPMRATKEEVAINVDTFCLMVIRFLTPWSGDAELEKRSKRK